ncbi:MAG: hypothetical protein K5666_00435, partial [Bacilli bacterium]|nr:hypothetical protein [Bacilli bacterium]
MGIVYHGSKEHGIKRLEPRESTHGTYVYATPEKVLAIHFSGRSGDDLTYELARNTKDDPWELIELIPNAFDKMYSNDSSIYSLSDETFKNINTGFEEVVSDVGVDIINEEYYENVFDALLHAQEEGLVKLYRYPSKPELFPSIDDYLIDKTRHYKERMNKQFGKNHYDRFVCLHPSALNRINELLEEFGIDFKYNKNDLIALFRDRCEKQLHDLDHEQYIDSS